MVSAHRGRAPAGIRAPPATAMNKTRKKPVQRAGLSAGIHVLITMASEEKQSEDRSITAIVAAGLVL